MTTALHGQNLALSGDERSTLWDAVRDRVERYFTEVSSLPVAPPLDAASVRALLAPLDFETAVDPVHAVEFAADGLTRWQVHTPHPRYFGLFNPAPTTMGIAADTLVAAFNPQMAAWSHNPFAAEAEAHLIRAFGARFGYDQTDGTFCSGGMEANHTAVLAALTHRFPAFVQNGVEGEPVLYVTAEAHHSFRKAARLCGIGERAVREIATDDKLRMCPDALSACIADDIAAGRTPFLVVGTAGTTAAGIVDPLDRLAQVAAQHGLWFHVDAAWGGAAALLPELRSALAGIEQSDSITFDAHKWLSVPMGAGVFLTRHPNILSDTFRVVSGYMPKDAAGLDVDDPHLHSMQWSRRFIGLKVLLSLMVAGWDGYAAAIRHQTAMGDLLRRRLREEGWEIANETVLPVVCVTASGREREIAARVVQSGAAWISPAVIGGRTVIRACVTHYGTQPADVEALVQALGAARIA